MTRVVKIGDIKIGTGKGFAIFAGPCVIETEELAFSIASHLKSITRKYKIPYVFKASYDKANRLSIDSYRGPGLNEGLRIISNIKKELDIPILLDVHSVEEIEKVAEVADIIQIPAFLCRQTDLVVESAKTQKPLHIKKGQFMAPEDMLYIAQKAEKYGNAQIILCERGTSFGYHNLVVDFRSIPIMKSLGYPVSYDATHSLQFPGKNKGASGGAGKFAFKMAMAGLVMGADVIFFETHPNPKNAPSDSAVMMKISKIESLLEKLTEIYKIIERR